MRPFVPRRRDVHRTRALLHHRLGLPNELALDILDKARYWVEHVHENDRTLVILDEEFSDNFSESSSKSRSRGNISTTSMRSLVRARNTRQNSFSASKSGALANLT